MDEALSLWGELETLWSPEETEWDGCGYEGTAGSVEPMAFNSGNRGCTQYEETADLFLLFICVPIAMLIIIIICYFFKKKSKEKTKQEKLLADKAYREAQ